MRPPHWLVPALGLACAAGCGDFGADGLGSGPDPDRDRDFDGVPNAQDCAPDDPNRWQLLLAFVDEDQDGYGAGPQISSCFGSSLSYGYSAIGTDCDDTEYDAWQLMERYIDADHDGVGAGDLVTTCATGFTPRGYADSTGDCAPDDGTRWRELAYLYVDGDHDGYTVPGAGAACSGASLPPGYAMDPSGVDCNDADAAAFVEVDGYPDADADGHGIGIPATFCTGGALPSGFGANLGDCAPEDGSAWQDLYYSWIDLDRDGYTIYSSGIVCSGYGLPAGYKSTPSVYGDDCDDADRNAWTPLYGYADSDRDGYGAGYVVNVCTDGRLPPGWVKDLYSGTDCDDADPMSWRNYAYSYRDADGDGYRISSSGSVCYGTSLPAGYFTSWSATADCNDADPALFTSLSGYPDADGDGYGAAPRQTFCTAGSLPSNFVADGTDCAADDPALWRSYAFSQVDRDGDGYTARESGTLCIGATLPDPYRATAVGNDCDDADPALYRWVVLYADADGDGVGAPPRWIPCLGATIPAGWSVFGYDEDDLDPAVQAAAGTDVFFTILD